MLESKLVEAKSKKDTLKARAKTAQTSRQIADMVQGLNSSNAVTAFERMEEKVMSLEAEAESTLQVRHTMPPWKGMTVSFFLASCWKTSQS